MPTVTTQLTHAFIPITAVHEEKVGGSTSRREFKRTVDLPDNVNVNLIRSVYSRDGILHISAPITPPGYSSVSITLPCY